MRQTKVHDAGFTAITACGALETLDLSLCDNLQEITAVGSLQRLRVVHLSSCLGLRLVDGLADCPALELVNLSYCPRLTRVLPLLAHPTLHTLLCRETSAKLPPYQELLHRARYYFTHPQDPLLSPIVSKLQWVDFSACRSLGEISVLSLLPNLRYLNLRGTSITRLCHPDLFDHFDDLSLTYLLYPSLVRMDLSACRALHDLSALAWSERLREVNMDDCVEVLEFSVLLTCPSLNLVTAARCQTPNVSLPTVINSGSTLQQRLLRTKHHSGRLIFSTSVSTV
ncbi:hypothetical protein AGDE_17214 [Angomonas deanei]|uniref:Leucine Rich repeat n=1 Tax=Angomonas deanei TaxID=59799 RepID=A0A7G2CGX7_9TRYP|nr:hypothetical protein AGDE_17214 [Angomonas deanei]CAD2218134.1 hypothetical protein, conserved [Angomonas deanei]|eukprot:EPY15030.1 hypothetical protein AGDE_17214 [Angomonas deanei]